MGLGNRAAERPRQSDDAFGGNAIPSSPARSA
jgi:hypothetical protein